MPTEEDYGPIDPEDTAAASDRDRDREPERDRDRDRESDRDRDRGIRQRVERLVPDLVKRTFYAGLGAVFTTEEGIRKLANEFSLPKDVASYLIHSAQSTKDELFRVVAKEMREFLQSVNMTQEIAKLLTTLSFEIKTEIRFIPNDEGVFGVKPQMKPKVAVKKSGEDV